MTEIEKDKVFKLVLKMQRNHNKPDLHSFVANTKDGRVYVEGQADGCYVEHCVGESFYQYHALPVAVANLLIQMEIDLDSVEI